MKNGGPGLGSALALLIFSTLCLILFAVVSLSTALSDKALADAAARTVKGYYEADTFAESILAKILESETIPDIVLGVSIKVDTETGAVTFSCPISDANELYVEVLIFEDRYSILKWQMRNLGEWEADTHLPVWHGE